MNKIDERVVDVAFECLVCGVVGPNVSDKKSALELGLKHCECEHGLRWYWQDEFERWLDQSD